MRTRIILRAVLLLLAAVAAHAQNLDAVLDSMDRAAANFHDAQTDFVWDNYTKAVDEHDLQKGIIYFRRQGADTQMAADITVPDKKYVLFSGGTVSIYIPKAGQVTQYNAGKNKADFETFLVLGFGGRGQDLSKSFEVKYAGTEQVQGVNAAKLELTPKSKRVANMFNKITLWIDPARGVSVQQLFNTPGGDYRVAKYSDIKINGKLPNDVFKLKTSGKVTYVKPNG
ncbi:MAG TPA: outer membrane lipoprotein carrier protein LolA [Candidatus Bathyarchaeia archaeon]|nr:outer membrane lipoprotein carrier protein LolA [Candidatus Bathyarchaeia archaeon]